MVEEKVVPIFPKWLPALGGLFLGLGFITLSFRQTMDYGYITKLSLFFTILGALFIFSYGPFDQKNLLSRLFTFLSIGALYFSLYGASVTIDNVGAAIIMVFSLVLFPIGLSITWLYIFEKSLNPSMNKKATILAFLPFIFILLIFMGELISPLSFPFLGVSCILSGLVASIFFDTSELGNKEWFGKGFKTSFPFWKKRHTIASIIIFFVVIISIVPLSFYLHNLHSVEELISDYDNQGELSYVRGYVLELASNETYVGQEEFVYLPEELASGYVLSDHEYGVIKWPGNRNYVIIYSEDISFDNYIGEYVEVKGALYKESTGGRYLYDYFEVQSIRTV